MSTKALTDRFFLNSFEQRRSLLLRLWTMWQLTAGQPLAKPFVCYGRMCSVKVGNFGSWKATYPLDYRKRQMPLVTLGGEALL